MSPNDRREPVERVDPDAASLAGMAARRDRFDELGAAFAGRQRSRNTQTAYQADLDGFGDWCDAHDADPVAATAEQVADYRTACEADGASPATIARRLSTLSSFFAYAVNVGSIDSSPVAHTARPQPGASATTELTAAQIAAVLAASSELGGKTEVLVDLLLRDGVKLGEALAADADDLSDAGHHLSVDRRRGTADITLHDATTLAIHAYLQGRQHGPLLLGGAPGRADTRLTRFGADYLLKRVGDLAGLDDGLSANMLRRSYVTNAVANGDSIETIRDHLGHQDSRTTRRHID